MSRRAALSGFTTLLVLGMIAAGAGSAAAGKPEVQHGHEYAARGSKGAAGGFNTAPLTSHGGDILTSSSVKAIFWGSSWNNSTFVGNKITGLDSFYAGWTGSNYARTTTEYNGASGFVTGSVSYGGHLVDTSAGPTSPPSTAQIVAEVQKQVTAGAITPTANGYYPVYVDLKRGSAGYCAWHDTGTVTTTSGANVQIQVAFFFNLDKDSGCDPKDTWTTNGQSLASLANVSGHELSEAETDPHLNAWFDRRGYENADKCAWTFNKVVSFSNGTKWKIQGNWSNAAYNNHSGYLYGCIDGN
jgi:hypothetical protein